VVSPAALPHPAPPRRSLPSCQVVRRKERMGMPLDDEMKVIPSDCACCLVPCALAPCLSVWRLASVQHLHSPTHTTHRTTPCVQAALAAAGMAFIDPEDDNVNEEEEKLLRLIKSVRYASVHSVPRCLHSVGDCSW